MRLGNNKSPKAYRVHRQDKSKWRRAPPRGAMGKLPQRFGNPRLSFKEYRREHDGCWIYYGKNLPHKRNHKRKFHSDFNTVFVPLLLLAAGVGFPAACFWR